MTESIKQWVADQALKEYPIPPKFIGPGNAEMDRVAFSAGLEKGIEIAEGFAEFCMEGYIAVRIANAHEFIFIKPGEPQHKFTTSQLLEKYLKTLEP